METYLNYALTYIAAGALIAFVFALAILLDDFFTLLLRRRANHKTGWLSCRSDSWLIVGMMAMPFLNLVAIWNALFRKQQVFGVESSILNF